MTDDGSLERPVSAHLMRPVAIPDDVDDPSIEKARGVVELPLRVRWTYPQRSYDLDDPRQRRRVYEQVLSEGLDDDVRRFIDVDRLIEDWGELVLPQRVRIAWTEWLRRTRGPRRWRDELLRKLSPTTRVWSLRTRARRGWRPRASRTRERRGPSPCGAR